MTRKFIATILAAAIAVTTLGSTAQAHHRNDDLIKFLGAATTLIIIGNALKHKNHNHGYYPHKPYYGHTNYHHKPKPALPRNCIRKTANKKGHAYHVFNRHCLKKTYKAAHKLPSSCALRYRGKNGHIRHGYGITCLKNKGYKIH